MILTDREILQEIEKGNIVIEPFDRTCLGSNSYDVHLSEHLIDFPYALDPKKESEFNRFSIPEKGWPLEPGRLYLGSTIEYTETHKHVPFLEGKSSTGRLGISVHATAGKGDVGFCNHWTLEISVIQPVMIYAGMPIAQLIYFMTSGDPLVPYNKKGSAKYNGRNPRPMPSQMWKNFQKS